MVYYMILIVDTQPGTPDTDDWPGSACCHWSRALSKVQEQPP
jgi:hypothetical protein